MSGFAHARGDQPGDLFIILDEQDTHGFHLPSRYAR
jgi:hypothetical protein